MLTEHCDEDVEGYTSFSHIGGSHLDENVTSV